MSSQGHGYRGFVELWVCGAFHLMTHMVIKISFFPNECESCLLSASVDLWNSGNGGLSLMGHMVNDLLFFQ